MDNIWVNDRDELANRKCYCGLQKGIAIARLGFRIFSIKIQSHKFLVLGYSQSARCLNRAKQKIVM